MRRSLVVAVALMAQSGVATGDTLVATRGQNVSETSHTVDVEVREGLAYYRIRRVFRNRGKVADEARVEINLPYGAVATGLRIKGKKGWHTGELMHARKAEELYVELTGMGPSEPKDPALLYWRWTDELALRVFPIMPGTSNTVEYTLTAPTTYADGTYYFTYGRKPDAKNLAAPVLRVRGSAIAHVEIDGEASERTTRLGRVRLHPVLVANNIENPKVLVRPLAVRGQPKWSKLSIDVDLRHTWRGDIELAVVDPGGALHGLRDHDLGDGANDLVESYELDYDGDPNGTWYLLVTDHHPLDGGTLRSWTLRPSDKAARAFRDRKPAFIPQPTESRAGLATAGVRFQRDRTAVRLGRVDLLPKKQFARFEVDVARRLSKLPRPLSVSFVLDASHTMDRAGIRAQLDIVDAYLEHVPWADVELVAFGRNADRLTRGFEAARTFDQIRTRLNGTRALLPRNGSFLDRGVELAVPALTRRKGSRALVILTDDRLRSAWNNERALAHLRKLPDDVVVHVVEVAPRGSFALERHDDHRLFPLARLRGGVALQARGILEAKRSDLVSEALYLVRPTRLDHVTVKSGGSAGGFALDLGDSVADGDVLPEGTGARWMGPVAEAPRSVAVTGQLWSRPVRYDAASSDEPFNRATAGFVFSHDHYDDLSDNEQFVLAMYAGAVSPVTSYLAVEPGVRPSVIGLEHGSAGFGSLGSGRYGTIGHGSAGVPMSWQPIIDRVARACRSHGRGQVEVRLELQSHEIADIGLTGTSGVAALDRCVVETLWNENLSPSANHPASWTKALTVDVDG